MEVFDFDGGRTRARTLDPLIKSQLLYQLSYAPIESCGAWRPAREHGIYQSSPGLSSKSRP
jgi:hypothetical protein